MSTAKTKTTKSKKTTKNKKEVETSEIKLSYLDDVDIESVIALMEEQPAVSNLSIALSEGLSTDLNKTNFQFTVLDNKDMFEQGRNNEVVFSLRGKLFYQVRLVFARSSEKIRLKLSLYIPIKLNSSAEPKKLEVKVIPVNAGTIFEMVIATTEKKQIYELASSLMKEVKLMTLNYSEESDILERFTDKTIMH